MAENAANAGASSGASGQAATQANVATTQSQHTVEMYTKAQVESLTSAAVNEALKKKETEFKALLDNTKSTAEEKLNDYQKQLAQERARAEFHAAAIGEGVVDVKAAWAVAVQFSLIKDEKVDWKGLKEAHPTLFRDTRQTSSAGKQGDTGTGPVDMSTLIRRAAGIRP